MKLVFFRRLIRDERGVSAIMIAVMAAIIIGFASLGIEVVAALQTQRHMQAAADSAALSSVMAQVANFPANYAQEGYGVIAKAGFTSSNNTCTSTPSTVYVGSPCTGDKANSLAACTTQGACIEALIRQPYTLYLARLVWGNQFVLQARAVASSSFADGCVAILDPKDKGSFTVGGTASVNLVGCSMYINSAYTPGAAINNGGATISCQNLYTVGTATGFDQSTCPTSQSGPITDPYAGVPMPSKPANKCNQSTGTVTNPPCYFDQSNKLSVSTGNTLKLCPGLYYVTGNNGVKLSGTGTLQSLSPNRYLPDGTTLNPTYDSTFSTDCPNNAATDSGVTFALTGGAQVSMSGGNIILEAPVCDPSSSGTTGCSPAGSDYVPATGLPTGMLFFQDKSSGSACSPGTSPASSFTGGSTSALIGTLYFPTQCVSITGSSFGTSSCLAVVSYQLKIDGGPNLNATLCNPFHARQIKPVSLVE